MGSIQPNQSSEFQRILGAMAPQTSSSGELKESDENIQKIAQARLNNLKTAFENNKSPIKAVLTPISKAIGELASNVARFFSGSGTFFVQNKNQTKQNIIQNLETKIKNEKDLDSLNRLIQLRNEIANETRDEIAIETKDEIANKTKVDAILTKVKEATFSSNPNVENAKVASKIIVLSSSSSEIPTLSHLVRQAVKAVKPIFSQIASSFKSLPNSFISLGDVAKEYKALFGKTIKELPDTELSKKVESSFNKGVDAVRTFTDAAKGVSPEAVSIREDIKKQVRSLSNTAPEIKERVQEKLDKTSIAGTPSEVAERLKEVVDSQLQGANIVNPERVSQRDSAIKELHAKVNHSALPDTVKKSVFDALDSVKNEDVSPQGIENLVNNIVESSGYTNEFSLDNPA